MTTLAGRRPTLGWKSLMALLCAALIASLIGSGTADASVRFSDVSDGNTFSEDIDWLASRGVTRGCNPPDNTRFCPDDRVTRGQMAAFLSRALDLPSGNEDFSDTNGHIFEGDISRLASAGITRGCNPPDNTRFCPDDHVTRGQMAAFLNRALDLDSSDESFSDTAGHVFEADAAALAGAGITRGCNPPDNTRFCPNDYVTRGQMAAFVHRALPDLPAVVTPGANVIAATTSGYQPSISADGRFVAYEAAANGDTSQLELQVYDRSTGSTSNITSHLDGQFYMSSAISGNGRWVATITGTGETNPDTGDTQTELWVIDRVTGDRLVIADVNGSGEGPDMSHDGRYVVFESSGTHIDPTAPEYDNELYRWDRETDSFIRFSVDMNGENPDGGLTESPAISGDGSKALFVSNSPNMSADTPGWTPNLIRPSYVYLKDFDTGDVTLVSRTESGGPAEVLGYTSLSADGNKIAYVADIADVMPSRGEEGNRHFIQDVNTGQLTLVPTRPDDNWLNRTALSSDGSVLAYIVTPGDELDDTNQLRAYNVGTDTTMTLSQSASSELADRGVLANTFYPGLPALSDNGQWVAFTSSSTNLGGAGGSTGMYVYTAEVP